MFYNLQRNVKFLRKKNKLTLVELAYKLGLGKSTIANFENDQINCSLETLDKLSKIFNISLDDLVYKEFK